MKQIYVGGIRVFTILEFFLLLAALIIVLSQPEISELAMVIGGVSCLMYFWIKLLLALFLKVYVEIEDNNIKKIIFGYTLWSLQIISITDISPNLVTKRHSIGRYGLIIKSNDKLYTLPEMENTDLLKRDLKTINPDIKDYSLLARRNALTNQYMWIRCIRAFVILLLFIVIVYFVSINL